MKTLRIMSHRQHEKLDHTLSFYVGLESILNEIRKTIPVKEIWIVDYGGSSLKKYDEETDVYNVYSFRDFNEIIDVLRPDLIISVSGDNEYIERSMFKAAGHRGIPTIDIMTAVIEKNYFKKRFSIKILRGRIFVLFDHGQDLLRRYFYLLKTLHHSCYGIGNIFNTIIKDIYLPLITFNPRYNFGGGGLNIVSSPEWIDYLVKKGINRDSIKVVGDISLDSVYLKLQNISNSNVSTKKNISILFITSQMVEHGYWLPWMREKVVREVVRTIKENFSEANFLIKIHPIREKLDDYVKIVHSIDPEIKIIQNSDLTLLIRDSDFVIGFGLTSAYFQALILSKPVLLMNMFDEDVSQNIYIRENLITECKTSEELLNHIKNSTYLKPSSEKINEIIEKIFYKFDGKCSQRAALEIFSFIKARKLD